MNTGETARAYHEWTSNGTGSIAKRPPRPAGYRQMDPQTEPASFKRYPQARLHHLPVDLPSNAASAADVLAGLAPQADAPVGLQKLARLLHFSTGVTRISQRNGKQVHWRPASSAGNRHPIETYVVSGDLEELDGGVYHFAADVGALERLRDGDHRPFVADAAAERVDRAGAEAFVVLTGVPWRTAWKYAERGWRHLYWDAGTLCANLLAMAEAYGIPARLLFGFQDTALCQLLGIDGRNEFPLVVVALGKSTATPQSTPATTPDALRVEAAALLREPVEFPLITVAQHAGALQRAHDVRAWRTASLGTFAAVSPVATEAGQLIDDSIEAVILKRATTRTMRPETVPNEALNWAMACATRPVPMDAVPAGHTLLTHHLSVHAVDGADPGHYLYQNNALTAQASLTVTAARARAAHLCLDQPVGGDSAYTLFTCTDLDGILRSHGDRGYRIAQTEAGVVVGRLQLAASAMGFGASGLTFYDQEVQAVLAKEATCMLACAVGTSARKK